MVKNPRAKQERQGIASLIPGSGRFPWSKKWPPTPVFLPGKTHGQKRLSSYSSWGHKASDTTEQLTHAHVNEASLA